VWKIPRSSLRGASIEEAMKMKPEEYLTYFEAFIFVADKESG
jgi:hypothetical protein